MKQILALWSGFVPHRLPVTLEKLEQRIDEVESGKVKAISSQEFDARIALLRKSIGKPLSHPVWMAII